jgi:hypothetical protein
MKTMIQMLELETLREIAQTCRGTPRTLKKAVMNGFEEISKHPNQDPVMLMCHILEDFLGNRFSPFTCTQDALAGKKAMEIFKHIMAKETMDEQESA